MNRNYSLDYLKVFLAFGVVFIHVGTYIITPENMSNIEKYLYSMTSLIVPIFFIISGYLFHLSKNKIRNFYALIKIYLIYSLITIVVSHIMFDMYNNFIEIGFVFFGRDVGNLWFVNSLLYYMLFYIVVEKIIYSSFSLKVILSILFLFVNFIIILIMGHYKYNIFLDIIYFTIGFMIAKYFYQVTINKFLFFAVLLFPFIVGLTYSSFSIADIVFATLIFFVMKDVNMKESPILYFTNSTLWMLFIQWFIIYLFVYNFSWINLYDNYIGIYILISAIIILLYFMNNTIKKKIRKLSFIS